MKAEYSDAVRNLMAMNQELVSAKYIAPILRMKTETMVKRRRWASGTGRCATTS